MPDGAYSTERSFSFALSHSSDGKSRKIWGVCSTEAPDREMEIITEEAIQKALKDFMVLPIIHYFHSEHPIGWISKAKYGPVLPILLEFGIVPEGPVPERGLVVIGEVKNTPDCEKVWNGIVKGLISEWSIAGTRTSGSPECSIPATMRSRPCITKAMNLWSISICPRGTGQNRSTLVGIVKAMTSGGTALIHPVVDGTEKEIKKMAPIPGEPDSTDATSPPAGDDVQVAEAPPTQSTDELLKEVLAKVNAILEHLGGDVSGGEEKADEDTTPEEEDSIPKPTSTDHEEVKKSEVKPQEGEDDQTPPVKKCNQEVEKAMDTAPPENDPNSIVKAQADRITQLEQENNDLKAKTPAPRTIVIDPKIQKAGKPSLDGSAPGSPDKSRLGRITSILTR